MVRSRSTLMRQRGWGSSTSRSILITNTDQRRSPSMPPPRPQPAPSSPNRARVRDQKGWENWRTVWGRCVSPRLSPGGCTPPPWLGWTGPRKRNWVWASRSQSLTLTRASGPGSLRWAPSHPVAGALASPTRYPPAPPSALWTPFLSTMIALSNRNLPNQPGLAQQTQPLAAAWQSRSLLWWRPPALPLSPQTHQQPHPPCHPLCPAPWQRASPCSCWSHWTSHRSTSMQSP